MHIGKCIVTNVAGENHQEIAEKHDSDKSRKILQSWLTVLSCVFCFWGCVISVIWKSGLRPRLRTSLSSWTAEDIYLHLMRTALFPSPQREIQNTWFIGWCCIWFLYRNVIFLVSDWKIAYSGIIFDLFKALKLWEWNNYAILLNVFKWDKPTCTKKNHRAHQI